MSSKTNRDTELTIRVKDIGTKTFREVASSIGSITESLDKQVLAAERGEVSAGSLVGTIKQLKDANKALLSQQGLIDYYDSLAGRLDATKAKAKTARESYEAFADTLAKSGTATKAQSAALDALAAKADAADGRVVKATERLDAQAAKLEKVGLSTENLTASQQKLVTVNTAIEHSLRTVSGALESYDANVARTVAAEKALADAQAARVAAENAGKVRGSLALEDALTRALREQQAATEALADAETARVAAERGRNQKSDLIFLSQVEAALERQEHAQRQLAEANKLSSFNAVGDQALDAANKVDVYAAAAGRAAPASSRIAASLRAILEPSKSVVLSLSQLETEIDRVAAEIGDGTKSIYALADSFHSLDAVQQRIVKSATAVDAYKDQAKAVYQTQIAFEAAKADVIAYGNAVRSATEPNDELAVKLRQAQAAMNGAEKELTQQITKLREYGTVLTQAGIDVNDLATAQGRLQAAATKTAGATANLNKAQAGGGVGKFLGLKPYEIQNLSFQLNDVFTQLASGTSITQTFAQQGGQILQIFPQMIGQIGKLVPWILGIGVVLGPVIAAFHQLGEEAKSQRQFAGALALSADGARYQAQALAELSHEMDVYGGSLKDAKSAVSSFVKEGLRTDQLEAFGKAAQDLADVTGKKVPEAAQALAEGFTGGFDAIVKLNEQYDFLTAAELEHIRVLYDQGEAVQASEEAFDKFSTKLDAAATASRTDWQVSIRNLTGAWDNFLHTIGDVLPISEVTGFINDLAGSVRVLTSLLPKARAARDAAMSDSQTGQGDPRAAGAARTARLAQVPLVGGLLAGMSALGQKDKETQAVERFKAAQEALAAQFKKITTGQTTVVQQATQAQLTARTNILRSLDEELEKSKGLTDARRIELAGIKAVREATNAGITDKGDLDTIRARAGEVAKADNAKRNAAKAAKQDRKDEAAARKAEAEENKRQQLQLQVMGQLRTLNAKGQRGQVEDLQARLKTIDDEYQKIFETLDKLKKAGGATVDGKSFDQITAEVNAGKVLLKQQEEQQFHQEKIAALEKVREARLDSINARVRSGSITAVQGYAEAQEVTSDIEDQITAAAEAALVFAKALRSAKPDPELEAFIANAEATLAGQKNKQQSAVANLGKSLFSNQQSDLDAVISSRDKIVANEQRLAETGMRTQLDAQANIQAAYVGTRARILEMADAQEALAKSLLATKDISPEVYEGMITDLALIRQGTVQLDANLVALQQSVTGGFTTGFTDAFNTVTTAIGQAIDGTGSWSDALSSLEDGVRAFGAAFLKTIGDALVQMLALQAIKSIPFLGDMQNGLASKIMDFTGLATGAASLAAPSATLAAGAAGLTTGAAALAAPSTALAGASTGLVAGAAGLTTAAAAWQILIPQLAAAAAALAAAAAAQTAANAVGVFHGGGTIGPGRANRSRVVSPSIFSGAPRYHDGTVVGLKSDEQAAILQNGEEVLDKDSPRNVLNGGGMGGNMSSLAAIAAKLRPQVRVVNAIDSGDFVSKGLDTPAGQQAVMNFIRSKASAIKQVLR